MNLCHTFVSWHLKRPKLIDLALCRNLPEAEVAFRAERNEAASVRQVLDRLNLLSVHSEPAVELAQLSNVEK